MKVYTDIIQGEQEWLDLRKAHVSGTGLQKATSWPVTQKEKMYELLAEEYIEEEYLNAFEIIQKGNEMEPIIKAKYEEITWEKVIEVGFVEQDSQVWLSPDWLILKDWKYKKAIEIKAPRWKNYIKYLLEDKIPKVYFHQVVHYFLVIEDLEELDFIIGNFDCSKEIPQIYIITVTREELQKDIDKATKKLKEFKTKWDTLKDKLIKIW